MSWAAGAQDVLGGVLQRLVARLVLDVQAVRGVSVRGRVAGSIVLVIVIIGRVIGSIVVIVELVQLV